MVTLLQKLLDVDRRYIYLFVALASLVPFFLPLGLPIGGSPAVQALYDRIEGLEPGSVVMVSFDYGPSTGPENDPMACTIIRHALARDLRVITIALYPLGGVTEAAEEFERATGGWDPTTREFRDFPGKLYGVDAVNLGYKDGAAAAMRQMNEQLHQVFPQDYFLRAPLDSLPLTREVRGYGDVAFVASIATGIIGEYWANLVNAQYGTPIAVGCTAVSAPKYFAYYRAGQMFALLGGLKGAAEYELLVRDAHPDVRAKIEADVYYAAKGWDVQSLIYSIIIVFIVLGNVAYIATRRSRGRAVREESGT